MAHRPDPAGFDTPLTKEDLRSVGGALGEFCQCGSAHRKCERLEGFAPQPLHKGNAEVSDECLHPLFVWRVDKAEICSLKQPGYAKVVSFEFSVTRVRLGKMDAFFGAGNSHLIRLTQFPSKILH